MFTVSTGVYTSIAHDACYVTNGFWKAMLAFVWRVFFGKQAAARGSCAWHPSCACGAAGMTASLAPRSGSAAGIEWRLSGSSRFAAEYGQQPYQHQFPHSTLAGNRQPGMRAQLLGNYHLAAPQRLMQHAAKKATQYFTEYLQKPQPLGRKELQQAAKHQSYLDITPAKGAEAKHYRKVLHRVCGNLEFRCSVRPLTEEVMLASFWDGDEPT